MLDRTGVCQHVFSILTDYFAWLSLMVQMLASFTFWRRKTRQLQVLTLVKMCYATWQVFRFFVYDTQCYWQTSCASVLGLQVKQSLYKISFKKEGLPSSECFNCFVRHLGTFFGTQ